MAYEGEICHVSCNPLSGAPENILGAIHQPPAQQRGDGCAGPVNERERGWGQHPASATLISISD